MLADGFEGVVQAGFDCAERDVQCISSFLQGHVVDEAHEQRLALLGRHQAQCLAGDPVRGVRSMVTTRDMRS